MIKRLLPLTNLFVLLIISSTAIGQNINIAWGKLNRPEKRAISFNILGERQGGIFVAKSDKKKNWYIERYGYNDLTIDFTRDVDFSLKKNSKSKKDRLDYEKVLLLDETIIFFATKYDKKAKQLNLFARIYNFEGRSEGKWEKIEYIQGEKKKQKGDFTVQISEDKKRFLVEKALPLQKNENVEKFSFVIFDNQLVQVFAKEEVKLKFKAEDTDLKGHRISKDNKVYFLATTTTGVSLFSFNINETAKGDDELREYKVELDKKDVGESAFSFDPEGNILVAGFFSDLSKTKYGGISGSYFIKLNPSTFEPLTKEASMFDKEFLLNFMSERRVRKGKTGLSNNFDMRHFITKADGGVMILAENHYVVENCSKSTPTGVGGITVSVNSCYYTYHYDEVIIININPDGTTKYNRLIKKRAVSRDPFDGNLSYSVFPTGNNLIMFYNDHYKNLREGNTKVRSLPKYRKRALVMANISDDGDITKEQLIRHKEIKLEVLPRYTVRTDKGLIMLGYYKKAIKLGRFEID